MTPRPSISILVRTYNSASTLPRLLSKLDLEPGDEILAVDSGSNDGTREVAMKLGAKVIQAPLPFNYSKSLNAGFKVASNPLVHVLSSHVIPMVPDLLKRMREMAMNSSDDVVAFYGPAGISGRDDLRIEQPVNFGRDELPKYLGVVGNANCLYRTAAWTSLAFDETIRTDEDKTWARAALDRGWRLAYSPAAAVLNKSHYSLAYMFRKGQSDARAVMSGDKPPMSLWHLAAALKKLFARKLRGEVDWGNWIRYSAHIFGQFSGTRLPKDNTPRTDSTTRP